MSERYEWTQERVEKLGFTPEEAESVLKSWGYRAPEDPEELMDLARRAAEYDRSMGMLSLYLKEGLITLREYAVRAVSLNVQFFPERQQDT